MTAIEHEATLLERDREVAVLRDALAEAAEARGRVVLIEGPAGVGKTSVLAAGLEAAAKAGFARLRARATELERDYAYGCVRQLLEPAVARCSEGGRLFAGAAALAEPLFAPTGATQQPAGNAFSVAHGLYWLLNTMAERGPIVLAVDDLQWADAESLRFLNHLAPRLDGLSVLVLGCARSGEETRADLARLAAGPEATVLRPVPLSIAAVATVCEARLGAPVAPEFADACHEATGGNPFFLEALLRDARADGFGTDARAAERVRAIAPATVARAVLLRLDARPRAATELVRAVAVLGDGAALAEAAALAGLDEPEAARAADLLTALDILAAGERLAFAHPIVREAVYRDIGPHERALAHARAAHLLAGRGAADERIAAQVAAAEPAGDAGRVELLRGVAADALRRGAPAAAVAWLRRALGEPPPDTDRVGVLLELGSAELRLGAPAAIDHLEAAVARLMPRESAPAGSSAGPADSSFGTAGSSARPADSSFGTAGSSARPADSSSGPSDSASGTSDSSAAGPHSSAPEALATAVRQLALALSVTGDADRAVRALESAIAVVEPRDRELALLLEAELASHALQASPAAREPAARRLRRHDALRGETRGERLVLASLAFLRARACETAAEAARHLEGALAGGRLLDDHDLDLAGPFYDVVIGLLATDSLDLVAEDLDRALAEAEARASTPAVAYLASRRGWVHFRRGEVPRAEACGRTAVELLRGQGIPLGYPSSLGLLIRALTESGEVEGAAAELAASGLPDAVPPGITSNFLLEARGHLHMAQGRPREALADFLELGRRDEQWGGANPVASRWRSHAALAVAGAGDEAAARRMAAEDLELARRWGAATGIGVALRASGLVEGSLQRLRDAVTELERSPSRLEHARALTDLGAALRRANRRAEARGALREGLDGAQRCGAGGLAARARIELRAAGARVSDPYGTGIEQLTVSERRVAELAAEGRSNPEIAQTLFVTRKTVETHLGSVYRKLGVAGRGELARALVP